MGARNGMKKQTVLIVDDIPTNIKVLGETLQDDYEIRFATSGEEALGIIQDALPDIVLLDIMMPEMNGFEVCRRLAAGEATRQIPVIFTTSMNADTDQAEGFAAGAVDYITKPFNPLLVRARVRTHLELKRHRDQLEAMVRQRTAELEKAKLAAEAASEAKSRFLSNVSHELKTPLNGIIGMNSLLMDTELTDEQQEYADIIDTSAKAQLYIINDILTFCQLEAGQGPGPRGIIALRTLVKEVVDATAIRARARDIDVIYTVAETVPELITGHPVELRQVLIYLVGNAVKFTAQGTVAVRISRIEGSADKKAMVQFDVVDSGIGISTEKRDEIFTPFFQADDSYTRKFGGIGLGLFNASRLVEMMGGKMTFETEAGKGTTFRFCIEMDLPEEKNDKKMGV